MCVYIYAYIHTLFIYICMSVCVCMCKNTSTQEPTTRTPFLHAPPPTLNRPQPIPAPFLNWNPLFAMHIRTQRPFPSFSA